MKKNIILYLIILLIQLPLAAQNISNPEIEAKIKNMLSQMTPEEKVGQMTQITLSALTKNGETLGKKELDPVKLDEALNKFHIGSILNTGGSANTIENWHEIITTIEDGVSKTRLKIPVIYGIDAIHGATYTQGSTLFPQSYAMAASRNRELVRKGAEITAYEIKASGIPWNFNPVLGMGRMPYWSRFWETFGEDVYLTKEMGREYIKGIQESSLGENASAAACMKHYLGYSFPLNGRDRTPAWIPERILREIFLPPFEEAVKANVMTVMVNSAEINGVSTHANHFILTELLKEELGFQGIVVSDWEDIKRLHTRDGIAETPRDAVKIAVLAGMDMSMVPNDYSFYENLIDLVNSGEVPMLRIDDAVSRILRVKYLTGLFDNPYPHKELVSKFASAEFSEVNLNAAREVITLLKNEDSVLPLNKDLKVLVTGPNSNLMKVLNGGWTITWQGDREELYPENEFTILEAIQDKIGKDNVIYSEGTGFDSDVNTDETVEMAKSADAIILCLGEMPYCETPGNINNLMLPEVQLNLAEKLSETGKPVILVMTEGRPRVITKIVDSMNGIIMGYLPGMKGGQAISDVIFGDVNPSGKLPFTYPKDVFGFTTYDHKPMESFDSNSYDPLFQFGFGLSYTTFNYSNLKLDKNTISKDGTISVSVDVTNSGDKAGKEAVELYITDFYGSISRPVKQLKGFEKILLEPGETKTVNFTISDNDLSFIGLENTRIVEPGEFQVTIKNLTAKFNYK